MKLNFLTNRHGGQTNEAVHLSLIHRSWDILDRWQQLWVRLDPLCRNTVTQGGDFVLGHLTLTGAHLHPWSLNTDEALLKVLNHLWSDLSDNKDVIQVRKASLTGGSLK